LDYYSNKEASQETTYITTKSNSTLLLTVLKFVHWERAPGVSFHRGIGDIVMHVFWVAWICMSVVQVL